MRLAQRQNDPFPHLVGWLPVVTPAVSAPRTTRLSDSEEAMPGFRRAALRGTEAGESDQDALDFIEADLVVAAVIEAGGAGALVVRHLRCRPSGRSAPGRGPEHREEPKGTAGSICHRQKVSVYRKTSTRNVLLADNLYRYILPV